MSTTLRARVRNGRLILDEPTDLPDGSGAYRTRGRRPDSAHRRLVGSESLGITGSFSIRARGCTGAAPEHSHAEHAIYSHPTATGLQVRRLLLRRSRYHVYFSYDPAA